MRPSKASANDVRAKEGVDEAAFEHMTAAAKEYIRENLRKNRESAKIYQDMLPQIHEFATYSRVEPVVFKCMDGRTQTNDHKGIPPTVATNRRSQGGQTNLTVGNREFWLLMNRQRLQAESNKASLLVIAAAHRSDLNTGCAAFRRDEDSLLPLRTDERALHYMHNQALELQYELGKDTAINKGKLAILAGMTNTDNGAMQLYSNGKKIFDAEDVISAEEIVEPSDVFEGKFLYKPIAEEWAHGSIKGKTPQSLLDGEEATFFIDMRVKIAFETYLMRVLSESKSKGAGTDIVRHDILKRLQRGLGEFNNDIKTFLTYVMASNVSYAAHYRNLNTRLQKEDPAALKARVSHAELKMAYSETGHDLEPPNSLLLIKPGSGDEEKSVGIGKDVLLSNLETLGLKDTLPPIVHINIELTKPINSWEEYLDVVSRMRTKVAIIEKVFGENVRMFTTYSYNQIVPVTDDGVCRTKQFMPLNAIHGNKRILVDEKEDIGDGMTKDTFDKQLLRERERTYTFQDKGKQEQTSRKQRRSDLVLSLTS